MSIFLQALNYLVDAYLMFAASAIAGNTFMRSLCGAGFPLFARQMFNGMGIQWASTLLGCVAIVLAPIPFIFYYYGAKIRSKSAYAPTFSAPAQPVEEPEEGSVSPATNEASSEKEGEQAAAMASAPLRESEANGSKQNV